jgi:hypothetical protein
MIGNIVRDVIMECGSIHNFDASETIRNLNLVDISVKMPSKKEKVVKEKVVKEKVVKEKKEKGRPKKPRRKIELSDDSTDLFAALVAKANEESEDEISDLSCDEKSTMCESIVDSVLDKVSIISENNEKNAEKAEAEKLAEINKKETEKAAKLAEINKKEAAKAEKEAAKLAEIKKKEAEKLAEIQKKEAEKAEKEAAKLAEIQKKEAAKAEKEAAKLAEIQKKEAAKAEKKESSESETEKKTAKSSEKKVEKKVTKVEVEVEEEPDVVKRFEFEGVKYLKSKNTGIIYNMEQDVIGKWNEKTGKIDFEEAGSEEEEDEYDE